ncbi:hypothetical protein HaLaN_15488 [Haematococcus lacustris]|uniref:Uncharacterized protein n=1 Tax=Haematococcus lacustris TaxID=44745 RepID=A0A699ZJ59_HAELA|nr:hypothetical protein HaLaN_15488 [Haematococcus lacustris]
MPLKTWKSTAKQKPRPTISPRKQVRRGVVRCNCAVLSSQATRGAEGGMEDSTSPGTHGAAYRPSLECPGLVSYPQPRSYCVLILLRCRLLKSRVALRSWLTRADDSSEGGQHITVPQQAAAAGPWVACLAAACTPGQGTPCPWPAELPALASSTAPVGATCSPQCAACSALHCSPCPATCLAAVLALPWQPCPWPCLCPLWAQLPAQPQCACCAWLAGECWAQAQRLLPVWLPGCCVGLVGACGGLLSGTTSCPALADHAAGSRLGAAGGGAPALLGASSLLAWSPCACSAAAHRAAGHSLLSCPGWCGAHPQAPPCPAAGLCPWACTPPCSRHATPHQHPSPPWCQCQLLQRRPPAA